NEIVKDVLLAQLRAGQVPFFAVLAATAQVRHRVNATHLQPGRDRRRKGRRDGNIESAVTVKNCRVVAIFLESFPIGQEYRHLGAVFALIEDLLSRELVRFEIDLRTKENRALAALEIVAVNGGRLGEADVGIK